MSGFIKNIFLPEKIKSYYLFSKIVVGIEINKTSIIATKTRISGSTSTIELIIEEKIAEDISEENFGRTSPALASIFSKIGNYDEIHAILPSSAIVFKELKLPFTSREKISMVVGFEIEPLLPFPLRDAIIDFIITRDIPEEKSSEIIVTATQKQQITNLIAIFEAIEKRPHVITVDMISVYGLYKQTNTYTELQGGTALIYMTSHSTSIMLMINGQLKMIRTLSKGIITLARQIAQELNKSSQEIIDYLLRFGFENSSEQLPIIEKIFTEWWNNINFTLNSFTTQFLNRQPMTKIIVIGTGSLIKDIVSFIERKSATSSELFNIEDIKQNPSLKIKNISSVTPVTIVSASATLPLPLTADYNLMQKDLIAPNNSLLLKQLITLILLTITLFATLITHYSFQTKKLRKEIETSEKEILTTLTSTFKTLEGENNVDDAIEEAEKEIIEQQKQWFAFSHNSRASFLQYLLELVSKIDKKGLNFNLEQIIIAEGILTLKAEVKDHEALKILERELNQSKLFSAVEPQDNPRFTMRITLATNNEELS